MNDLDIQKDAVIKYPKQISLSSFWQEVSKVLSIIIGKEYKPDYLREIYNGVRANKVIKEELMQAIITTNKTLKKRGQKVVPYLFSNRSALNIYK